MIDLTTARERRFLDDFATIFAHLWYRDFPFHSSFQETLQPADWTTHIGITVRSTADLLGLFTRFESSGRTDAVLRDNGGKAIAALEWEWSAIHRGDEIVTEFDKLKNGCEQEAFPGIHFACLVGYAKSGTGPKSKTDFAESSAKVLKGYMERWNGKLPPLLLVLVHFEWKGKQKGRQFLTMTIDEIRNGSRRSLREQPAYPWDVKGSRWEHEARNSPDS